MKKILYTAIAVLFISVAASAQKSSGDRILKHRVAEGFQKGDINRGERHQLRKDGAHYKMTKKNVRKDGKVTPRERKRVHNLKAKTRHDAFRFKHNRRKRVI